MSIHRSSSGHCSRGLQIPPGPKRGLSGYSSPSDARRPIGTAIVNGACEIGSVLSIVRSNWRRLRREVEKKYARNHSHQWFPIVCSKLTFQAPFPFAYFNISPLPSSSSSSSVARRNSSLPPIHHILPSLISDPHSRSHLFLNALFSRRCNPGPPRPALEK